MIEIIGKYVESLRSPNHRFKSWEHCYTAFSDYSNIDYLTLQLAFYLASWGMYRGSSMLLKKDYLIHKPVVELLCLNKSLRKDDVTFEDIPLINELSDKIKESYEIGNVSRTLITKILLGTLGCSPAIDRFFSEGWKNCEETRKLQLNIKNIVLFANNHKKEIIDCKKVIRGDVDYPVMKIVDMYFWQIGYDNYLISKSLK